MLLNPGFENGNVNWTEYSTAGNGNITQDSQNAPHNGSWYAWMGGYDNASGYFYQDVTIPEDAIQASLQFWYSISTQEAPGTSEHDIMVVEIRNPSDNGLLTTLATLSNLDKTAGWVQSQEYDLSNFAGQTIRLQFFVVTDYSMPTSFLVDDISLTVVGGSDDLSPNSPSDGTIFGPCSLINNHQPIFSWDPTGTYKKFTLLFSTSPTDFISRGIVITKASVSGTYNSWKPSFFLWKKMMTKSYNLGVVRDIYWKIVGTRFDGQTVETEVRSFRIGDPQIVILNTPAEGETLSSRIPPTFDFNMNCNKKFTLEFSPLVDFSDPKRIKRVFYSITYPNIIASIQTSLPPFKWTGIVRLVGPGGGGYFRIKAWDGINRLTISEVRSFTIQ